ncbi:hypothetical protein U1Q18_044591 [Sarracenia purpurea var. burkii]
MPEHHHLQQSTPSAVVVAWISDREALNVRGSDFAAANLRWKPQRRSRQLPFVIVKSQRQRERFGFRKSPVEEPQRRGGDFGII